MGIQETYLNIIKAIYDTPTVNILKSEKLKVFPLKSGTRQGLSTLATFIQYSFLAMVIRGEKVVKGFQIGKEEVKLPLSADDIVLCA